MNLAEITHCPGTLAAGFDKYSISCLRRVFNGRVVDHLLSYDSPASDEITGELFDENRKRMSISGVQEKFSVILDKNKLRLIDEGEQGTHILKPIPNAGKNAGQMPANEHLTMQIARQVFKIETAENALIFFRSGESAFITKRFDLEKDGAKLAKEDFASLTGRTSPTHGDHYKYLGNYLELFQQMKKYLPAYKLEAVKLYKRLLFNYLFSNGDAHLKNFSLLETPQGDFRLSPAYDLMNTRIHIEDQVFALDDGLLPRNSGRGTIGHQFDLLAEKAALSRKQKEDANSSLLLEPGKVETLVNASFLEARFKRSYLQAYQIRVQKMKKYFSEN